jgi:hypothetical protein
MAYTVPTAADLKAAFPPFAAVADETIEYWITRAGRTVDESWPEDDYTFAMMLLAAHLMTEQGYGTGAEASAAAAGASGFSRMKSGSLELQRDKDSGSGSSSIYGTTAYGRQFYALLRVVKGGPRVSPTGTLPYDPRAYPHGEA